MNKKIVIIPIIIIIVVIFVAGPLNNKTETKNEPSFHVTLASPNQYKGGIYSDTFFLEKGTYNFRFVPNGDSPQDLSIIIKGNSFEFSENFILKGEKHETGISQYYTWDYSGVKSFEVTSGQKMSISINPNGNVMGSVSIDLVED